MNTHTTLTYRPDIQGLRAVAITLVVLAHANVSGISGGFVGVDVFFVLSGYLITGLLVREYAGSGRIRLANFYARRLKRLLPALLAMLSVVLMVAPLLLSERETSAQTASAAYATTWTSNLFFAFSIIDYFSELQTRDLFLHTWSLGLEEQFYLVWPILLLLTLAYLSRKTNRNDNIRQLIWGLGSLFAASLVLLWYLTSRNSLWAFYLMPARIWQFALGAAVFVWFQGRSNRTKEAATERLLGTWGGWLGAAGLALILASAMLLHSNLTYPGAWASLPSLGAALVISAGHRSKPAAPTRLLACTPLVWIGDRSYSWYLWHWPVLMLGFAWGMQSSLNDTFGLIALSLLLATISYRWIEVPFWRGPLNRAVPARVTGGRPSAHAPSAPLQFTPFSGTGVAMAVPRTATPRSDRPLAALTDAPIIYAYDCDAWFSNSDVRPCAIGVEGATKTVVLLGDSIGAQWFSLLPALFRTPEWRTVALTKSACAMVDEEYYYNRIGKIYAVCNEWRNKVLKYLFSLKPDVVFMGSAATYGFSEEQWIEGSARVLERLTASAGQVFVVAGTPKLSFDGPGCLARHKDASEITTPQDALPCREPLASPHAGDVARYLSAAVKRFPNAKLLDLNDLVCPDGVCTAQTSTGTAVFRDSQHLTDSFVKMQVPAIAERINKLGLAQSLPR